MEDRKASNRKYYLANKEKIAAKNNEYYLANKEKIADDQRRWRESRKDGLFTVYLLPKEDYVGMTTSLQKRLTNHRTNHKRDITDAKVLGNYATKREALDVEASYHAKGFKGITGFKKEI